MRLEFMERQQKLTLCKGGRQALVLLNEKEEKREQETPEDEKTEVTVFTYDATWLDLTKQHDPVAAAREEVLKNIEAYDTSSAVNGFYLNGMLIPWSKDDPSSPNVDKRMCLRQNIADKVALGEENISIWMKGMSFTMPCAQAEMLMRSIENYAYECFNVTAAHKKAVSELTDIAEVLSYDYTKGYPEKLSMMV